MTGVNDVTEMAKYHPLEFLSEYLHWFILRLLKSMESTMAAAKETQEQQEFREYCGRWLTENQPSLPEMPLPQAAYEVMTEDHRVFLCDWQAKCHHV